MLGIKRLMAFILCMTIAGGATALVAPRDGGKLPDRILEMKAAHPEAFTLTRAWIQKVARVRERREAFLAEYGPQSAPPLPAAMAVAGTLRVPVLLCEFNNVPGPYDSTLVQEQLFGNNPTGSITDYYSEVSYDNLVVTGTVYDWATLAFDDTYYEGAPGCNGFCSPGMLQLLTEVLDTKDPAIDFGMYDNDGPDGVPNSGDDDGFVDMVSFVQPEYGGECNVGLNNNIWSHQWLYELWAPDDLPYETDDASANGGFIQINDYTMQPAENCPGVGGGMIDIGVFCHEFFHALGMPDLYDTNGQGGGIGYWGIMGAGNWNTPDSPAHPCAWTRMHLGWITPTDIDWQEGPQSLEPIATTGEAFRLPFTFDRFRRSSSCAINGGYSLYCGLTDMEGYARGWGTKLFDRGYGNNWRETIEREFDYTEATAVSFSYAYQYDAEATYDFCYALVEVGGTEYVLQTYSGTDTLGGIANHDLTPYLSGLTPPATYTIKFRATSNPAKSDEDDLYNSVCGLFVVDDVSVTGGGVSYSADFEQYVDGWYQSPDENPSLEYWLAENRQPIGFDAHLPGVGLLIMHVDETVIWSPFLENSGGDLQGTVKGVMVEEADGLWELQKKLNFGDDGDVYPGSSNNTVFDTTATTSGPPYPPASLTNTWQPTEVSVVNIALNGQTITAGMRAGDPAPIATDATPSLIDNDATEVSVTVSGDFIEPNATMYFTMGASPVPGGGLAPADAADMPVTSVRWVDPVRVDGTIYVYSKAGGTWDLVVTNPSGQQYILPDAITINQVVAAQLQSAAIVVDGDAIRLEYILFDREPGETIQLSRSPVTESRWTVIDGDLRPASESDARYVYVDSDVTPGTKYYYKLDVAVEGGETRELHRGSATVPAGELTLAQNSPNPFNPTTSIAFYLPGRAQVKLEVFDVAGRLVTRLAQGVYGAGPHRVDWSGVDANGTPVSSGVYVYRLTAGKQSVSKKMILLK